MKKTVIAFRLLFLLLPIVGHSRVLADDIVVPPPALKNYGTIHLVGEKGLYEILPISGGENNYYDYNNSTKPVPAPEGEYIHTVPLAGLRPIPVRDCDHIGFFNFGVQINNRTSSWLKGGTVTFHAGGAEAVSQQWGPIRAAGDKYLSSLYDPNNFAASRYRMECFPDQLTFSFESEATTCSYQHRVELDDWGFIITLTCAEDGSPQAR